MLVTGGAGFIGHHTVLKLVEAGKTVLVIDDLRHACGAATPSGVDQVVAELSSAEAAAAVERFQPDAVLHLAAQGGVSRSVRDPAGDARVNVVGTVALLKATADAGCKRFVVASSGGAIYGHARRLPSPEGTPARPLSPYGAAKLAAEGYLGMFGRTFGIAWAALRYSNVYGPYQDGTGEAGVVAITCERLLNGQPPEIRGDGEQTRDFVYVGDVARANLLALDGEAMGAINIGTGRETSVNAVVGHLVEAAGWKGPVRRVAARPGEVRRTCLEISRAKRLLAWHPSTRLEDGLRQTFVSFAERVRDRGFAGAAIPAPAGLEAGSDRGSPAGSGSAGPRSGPRPPEGSGAPEPGRS